MECRLFSSFFSNNVHLQLFLVQYFVLLGETVAQWLAAAGRERAMARGPRQMDPPAQLNQLTMLGNLETSK